MMFSKEEYLLILYALQNTRMQATKDLTKALELGVDTTKYKKSELDLEKLIDKVSMLISNI